MAGDVQTQGLLWIRQAEGPLRAVRFLAAPWQQPATHRPIVAPSVPSRVVGLQHSTLVNEVNAKVGRGSLVRVGERTIRGGGSFLFSLSQPIERGDLLFGSDCWEQNSFICCSIASLTSKPSMIDVPMYPHHPAVASPSDSSTVFYDALDLLSDDEEHTMCSKHKKTPPQNRSAQWFDGEPAETNNPDRSSLALTLPPLTPIRSNTTSNAASSSSPPLPGDSPNSAFQSYARVGKSMRGDLMSLPAMDHEASEVEKRSASPSAGSRSSSCRDGCDDFDVINPAVSIHEVNIHEDDNRGGKFCAIVQSRSYNLVSPSAADVYAIECAQSMEQHDEITKDFSSDSPISKCRLQREDTEVGDALSKSPAKWLPSPMLENNDTRAETPKMSSRRRSKAWSPQELIQKRPLSSVSSRRADQSTDTRDSNVTTSSTDESFANASPHPTKSDQSTDTRASNVTTSSTDESSANASPHPTKSTPTHDGDNPFLIDVSEDSLYIDIDEAHNEDGFELAMCDRPTDSPATILDKYTPSSSERSPGGRLHHLLDTVTLPSPKRLFAEFSPSFTSPVKLRSSKKNASRPPMAVLPRNAVTAQSGAVSDPLLLIGSITMAHAGPIWRMEFSPDGRYLATAGDDGLLSIYQVAPKKLRSTDLCPTAAALAEWEAAQGAPPPTNPQGTGPELGTEIEILSSKPIRRYREHTADIVDLSWSHTGFLLTASLDKTVRLWHVSKKTSLKVFAHPTFVTSVNFHPTKDKYFVSGSFDRKVRVWDTPTGRVSEWAQAPDRISSVSYTPDEEYIVAGLFRGQVSFYTADGLKYYTQIAARDRHGTKKSGAKVTGFVFRRVKKDLDSSRDRSPSCISPSCISPTSLTKDESYDFTPSPRKQKRRSNRRKAIKEDISKEVRRQARKLKVSPKKLKSAFHRMRRRDRDALVYKEQILVSTNDSRMRLFGLDDYCMEKKYRGAKNSSLQIKARISESGQHMISGSDSGGMMHIWNASTRARPLSIDSHGIHTSRGHEKVWANESFQVSNYQRKPIITDAHFVPSIVLKRAMKRSGLFSTILSQLDDLDHDLSSCAIITCDYEGSIRILLRKHLFDDAIKAAGPEGVH